MPGIYRKSFVLILFCLCFLFFVGCVSPGKKADILALVDNEPITSDELKYSLEIEHRRQDLSSARTLDIPLYIQKLIDERLIIQEAHRNNLDKDPDIQDKVQGFIIRESVTKLYNDEVLQKVSVTEQDIQNYYDTYYERFSLDIIAVDTEQEALELLGLLRDGREFKELSLLHPSNYPKNEEGEIILTRQGMIKDVEETLEGLQPGEFSEVLSIHGKFYIIQFIRSEKGPDSELETVRSSIERTIKKDKIEQLGEEYLERLREQSPVMIDRDILESMNLEDRSERDTWLDDDRILAKVYDSELTVGEFTAMLPKNTTKPEEKHLKGWIDIKLVDHAAINKHYDREPALQKKITRYRNELLKRAFFDKIVYPQIEITDEDLMTYYEEHQQDFLKPARYKIQQITLKTLDDAEDTLESLQGGANFSWLARQRSIDKHAQDGGARGWVFQNQVHGNAREVIGTLKPGDISPIVNVDDGFVLIRLLEKSEETAEDFAKVKDKVFKAYASREVKNLHSRYLTRLKEDAEITIFDDAVQDFESAFQ